MELAKTIILVWRRNSPGSFHFISLIFFKLHILLPAKVTNASKKIKIFFIW